MSETAAACDQAVAPPDRRHIFVFSVSVGGAPNVTEIKDTAADSIAHLANIIRTEQVLAVVIGNRCTFQSESVVSLQLGEGHQLIDRMPFEAEGGKVVRY